MTTIETILDEFDKQYFSKEGMTSTDIHLFLISSIKKALEEVEGYLPSRYDPMSHKEMLKQLDIYYKKREKFLVEKSISRHHENDKEVVKKRILNPIDPKDTRVIIAQHRNEYSSGEHY